MRRALSLLLTVALAAPAVAAGDVFDRVKSEFADNGGVRIHYCELGRRGPLVVFVHGFPDFWYGWRDQMAGLARHHRVVALDLRGYNLSDHPAGVESYAMPALVEDVAAVIRAAGAERATVVGHDWGGGIAWMFATLHPEMTERLVVLQTPHPRGLLRELRTNPAQRHASTYVDAFLANDPHVFLTPAFFAVAVTDPAVRRRYDEAYARSDVDAMIDYYRANYPKPPYDDVPLPNVQSPVLVIHGTGDPFLLTVGHNCTWDFVDGPLTIRTIPGAGHFVQAERSAEVTKILKQWLDPPRR
jgi:pimeloyl-ACP methyl ester carboxylesterase